MQSNQSLTRSEQVVKRLNFERKMIQAHRASLRSRGVGRHPLETEIVVIVRILRPKKRLGIIAKSLHRFFICKHGAIKGDGAIQITNFEDYVVYSR